MERRLQLQLARLEIEYNTDYFSNTVLENWLLCSQMQAIRFRMKSGLI